MTYYFFTYEKVQKLSDYRVEVFLVITPFVSLYIVTASYLLRDIFVLWFPYLLFVVFAASFVIYCLMLRIPNRLRRNLKEYRIIYVYCK